MATKMVLVFRADLKDTKGGKIRTGKYGTQASHASGDWFRERAAQSTPNPDGTRSVRFSDEEMEWLTDGMHRAICVKVPSEDALMEVYRNAVAAGLTVHLVTDAGLTQFGEPTRTCLGIGPHNEEKFTEVTGGLELL